MREWIFSEISPKPLIRKRLATQIPGIDGPDNSPRGYKLCPHALNVSCIEITHEYNTKRIVFNLHTEIVFIP